MSSFLTGWKLPPLGRLFDTPIIAVIDNDGQTQDRIDVDGDGVGDLTHGQATAMFVRKKQPHAKTWLINSEAPIPANASANEINRIACAGRIQALDTVSQSIRDGKPVEAVNMSLSTNGTTFAELGQAIGMDLSQGRIQAARMAPKIERDKLLWEVRQRLQELVHRSDFEALPPLQYRYAQFGKVVQAIENITRQGVPVYLAAGNEGPAHLNIYSIARGARTVAALNARGEKTDYTADNKQNIAITDWMQGDYNIKRITQNGQVMGYNLTGGNNVEVAAHQVSGQGQYINPILKRFQNAPLKNVLIRPQEVALLQTNGLNEHAQRVVPDLMHRIFPVDIYGQLKGLSPEATQKLKCQGDYTTWDGSWTFRKSKQGTLVYNPDGSPQTGREITVNIIRGTSFAAPSSIT